MAISSKPTSGQLPELAYSVDRCPTADESHAELHAPITAGLLVIRPRLGIPLKVSSDSGRKPNGIPKQK